MRQLPAQILVEIALGVAFAAVLPAFVKHTLTRSDNWSFTL